ncbi:MAG TPA: Uma2 family endonuclease [Gemmatimonadaceae bacterium]|nr:Uma2 family endonuclease [Gemmatimonadaceae bacterium]
MAQPAPARVYLTVEEFEQYDVPDDMQAELVRGELRLIPLPGFRHGALATRVARLLDAFVEPNRLGTVTVGSGYVLAALPRTVRGPDIAFVSASRLPPDMEAERIARFRPDLAIEILSPSEPASRLDEKLADYRAAGIPLAWVVDGSSRTVTVVTLRGAPRTLHHDDVLDGGTILPGFSCRVGDLFEGLR